MGKPNYFDRFDEEKPQGGNFFDQFDGIDPDQPEAAPQRRGSGPYPRQVGNLDHVRDYLVGLEADRSAQRAERETLSSRAGGAGRAATLDGLDNTPAWAMGLGGPSATLAGQSASDQVYGDAGIISPEAATEMRGLNSVFLGAPGLFNEDMRERLGQAGRDQPGASLAGDLAGYLLPGEVAWKATGALANAFAKPLVSRFMPQGGSAMARGTRVAGRGTALGAAGAGQGALYQGTVGESVSAAEEGRTPSFESAVDRAIDGGTDPWAVGILPGFMALNRIRKWVTTGLRTSTPDSVAQSVAAGMGRPTSGSVLDASRVGGDVDHRAETILIRMLNDAGFSRNDIADALRTFDAVAQEDSQLPALASRLKDVFIDRLGPRAEQVVQEFLQGAGVSRGGTAGQAVQTAAREDYGRLSDFLEDSANARLGSGSRFDTLTGAQDEMTRIGNDGYERVFSASPSNDAGVEDLRQALDFYSGSELAAPLRQVAAGRMLNVQQMIEADPRRAAHWMQHTANLKAQEAADAGNQVLARAYNDMRDQILRRLEADGVAPGYQQARMEFGDEFGIEQAVNFGSRFFTRVQDSVGVRQMADDLRNLTAEQQEAALLSIRDELLRLAGRGRQGAAPRLSQLNTDSALGGLETVVGEEGGKLANDIRFIDERLARVRAIDPGQNSRTISNTEARAFADRAVSNPFSRTVGNIMNTLGGDAAISAGVSAASGNVAMLPIMSIRGGFRAMGDRLARGRQGKVDDVTDLLLQDYGPGAPRPGMPGDDMPALTSRGGGGSGGQGQVGNAFSQTMTNQSTVPTANAFTRSSGFIAPGDIPSGAVYGAGGAFSGNFIDYNQDGQTDWQDMAIGAGGAATGAVGWNRAARAWPKSAPPQPSPPAPSMSPERAERRLRAEERVHSLTRRPSDAEIEESPWIDPRKDDTERFELHIRHLAKEEGMGAQGEALVEQIYAETQAAALQAGRRIDDQEFAFDFGERLRDVRDRMLEGDWSDLRAIRDAKPNSVGNAFAQSIMGGAGGSAMGTHMDLNGDGVVDEQDVMIGGAAGTVGMPLAGRAGNAFAGGRPPPPRPPSSPDRDRLLQSLQDPRMFEGDPVANARMLDNWQPPAEQRARPMGIGDAPPPVRQARQSGYQGADTGESAEWLSAVQKGLPMDQGARMARAKEMGFDTDTVLYHGTRRPGFDAFDPESPSSSPLSGKMDSHGRGVYFYDQPTGANWYADSRAGVNPDYIGGAVYPSYVRLQNPYRTEHFPSDAAQWIEETRFKGENWRQGFQDHLRSKGFDGIIEDTGNSQDPKLTVVFDTSNIRSVHAAFDPDNAGSATLLAGFGDDLVTAGIGGAAIAGGIQQAPEQRSQNANAFAGPQR